MSEIKRRVKSADEAVENNGQSPPRRQTRITLTKDVSSKYRKIITKNDTSKKGPYREPRSGDETGQPFKADKKTGFRGEGGKRPPARQAPSRGFSQDRGKPPAAAARREPPMGTALKAIINRGLPLTLDQVKQTQDLILSSAAEILSLAENLDQSHRKINETFESILAENKLLEAALAPLKDELDQTRQIITRLFEKSSFQDLAGQRLIKINDFLLALEQALTAAPATDRRPRKPLAQSGRPGKTFPAKPGGRGGSRLKGPQAPGKGMKQNDVDDILAKM